MLTGDNLFTSEKLSIQVHPDDAGGPGERLKSKNYGSRARDDVASLEAFLS